MRTVLLGVAALLVLVAPSAVEATTYGITDDGGDHRTDLCSRAQAVVNGSLAVGRALEGMSLTFLAAAYGGNELLFAVDATTGVQTGFQVDLMALVAEKAGFDYTINTILPSAFSSMTWSEYLEESLTRYDANIDWWMETTSRMENNMKLLYGIFDLSLGASQFFTVGAPDFWSETFISFAAPFTPQLWAFFCLTTVLTAIAYLFLERRKNQTDIRPGAPLYEKVGNIVYLGFVQATGGGGYDPSTGSGKLVLLSYSFLILLVVSAYTANLATFLVTPDVPSGVDRSGMTVSYASLETAVDAGAKVCVYDGTPAHEWLLENHPDADVVPTASVPHSGLAAGECDVAVATELNYQFALVDEELNKGCQLGPLEPYVRMYRGGWMANLDYHMKCTSLVSDTLGYHLLQLDHDGSLGTLVDAMNGAATTATCSEEEEVSAAQLDFIDMSGCFFIHGVICALTALYFGGARLHAHLYPPHPEKKKTDEDDREATKTDVTNIMASLAQLHAAAAADKAELAVLRARAAGGASGELEVTDADSTEEAEEAKGKSGVPTRPATGIKGEAGVPTRALPATELVAKLSWA